MYGLTVEYVSPYIVPPEVKMETQQIDEIREMFRNDDGSCKLSRSDVLRIIEKLSQQSVQVGGSCFCDSRIGNWQPMPSGEICPSCKKPRLSTNVENKKI